MTKPYTIIRRFLFELVGISLDRNYREVINLSFVLPVLCLNILKTEEISQFWDKNVLDVRDTSLQRKRLNSEQVSIGDIFHKNIYSIATGYNNRYYIIDINCCTDKITIDNEVTGLLACRRRGSRNYRMRVLITTYVEETILSSVSSIIICS